VERSAFVRVVELGGASKAEVNTRELSIGALAREIEDVEEHGYDSTAFRVDFYVKMASPFACLILPSYKVRRWKSRKRSPMFTVG